MPGRGDEALLRVDVPGIHVLSAAKTWMAASADKCT